jgi:hypothetical protein
MSLPVALAIAMSAPAWAMGGSRLVSSRSVVAKPGVVLKLNPKGHLFTFRAGSTKYTVTYASSTVWSAQLEKNLVAGWNVVVKGPLTAAKIAATEIVNNPKPERAACSSDAKTIEIAVAAYEAENPGKTPPTIASLTKSGGGGPYLVSVPRFGKFYRLALNWGGASPGKENGGKHPGEVDAAPVWIGRVGTYVSFDTEGSRRGCAAAT